MKAAIGNIALATMLLVTIATAFTTPFFWLVVGVDEAMGSGCVQTPTWLLLVEYVALPWAVVGSLWWIVLRMTRRQRGCGG